MRKYMGLGAAIAAVVALGALAGIGAGADKAAYKSLIDREVVQKAIEPSSAAQARMARSTTLRGKRRRGPKARYFVASDPSVVPASGATPVSVLRCPKRQKAISGFYVTSGGIVADWFTSGNSARKWEFAFINLLDEGGEAIEGIVCMTKV